MGDERGFAAPIPIDFERFFELAVDVMVVTRPDGRFEMVNSAFADLLGVDRTRILSSPWTDFVHPDDREGSVEENEREFEGDHRTMKFVNRYIDASGGVHWLDWNAELDTATGLVYGTARDVTDQLDARGQLEAALDAAEHARQVAEAANRAKSDFLSRMSHELRTPMNAVLGFAQLLEMDSLEPKARDSVQQILRAGRHLLGLIDEVLDIARIEIGEISVSVEPVSLASSFAEALSLLGPLATARGIALRSTVPEDEAGFVQADRGRLHQVLVNLLSNAIKYAPRGSRASVDAVRVDDGWVRVAVTDNGPGISADLLPRLFSPFERIGAERTGIEGTGLGLAHSKALVERMGGRIGVESVVGDGSTFWVELPAARDIGDAGLIPMVVPADVAVDVRGNLLYIEDNPANASLLERVVEHRPGLRMRSTMLGRLGIELARTIRPDVIALDLHLPDLSGESVLRELRADARTRDIPVIVLSADATRSQIEHLMASGADAYLTKPLDVAQLLATIDEHITRRRQQAVQPGD